MQHLQVSGAVRHIYIYIHTHTHIYIYIHIYVIRQLKVKLAGTSVQSTAGSRGVRISLSNAGYTTFGGDVRVLATHSIRQFPLHFPPRASPCATRFRKSST